MQTGITKQILANLIQTEDEITNSRLYLNHKKVLISDNKGKLKTFFLPNGQLYSENKGHHQEITQLSVDFTNRLVLSTSWDSSVRGGG